MMTRDQLDNWFTYPPPTEETSPKYAAIREAENACFRAFSHELEGPVRGESHDAINAVCRAFAVAIDEHAPDGADKSAAIQCVRVARNAANEAVAVMLASGGSGFDVEIERQARDNLRAARWQANSAIACSER